MRNIHNCLVRLEKLVSPKRAIEIKKNYIYNKVLLALFTNLFDWADTMVERILHGSMQCWNRTFRQTIENPSLYRMRLLDELFNVRTIYSPFYNLFLSIFIQAVINDACDIYDYENFSNNNNHIKNITALYGTCNTYFWSVYVVNTIHSQHNILLGFLFSCLVNRSFFVPLLLLVSFL